MEFLDVLKVVVLGIIEGITEWLPVSSTGHIMIFEHFFPLGVSAAFSDVFEYVIQLGAILAVVVVFFKRLFPFKREEVEEGGRLLKKTVADKDVLRTWLKVIIACIPAVLALVFDMLMDKFIDTGVKKVIVVSAMLIVYGIVFIVIEILNKGKEYKYNTVGEITYSTALFIGLFQVLAAVPGTSRSGITIIGALILGVSRVAAAEFTFFLAIPTMVGASGYKIVKYLVKGNTLTVPEISALLLGMAVAFAVSLLAIKFLMNFVKKHDFKPFGIYRIILGVAVLVLCLAF